MLGKKRIFIDPMRRDAESGKKGGLATISNDKLMPQSSAIADSLSGLKKNHFNDIDDREYNENKKFFEGKYREGVAEGLKEALKEQHKSHFRFYGLLNRSTSVIYKIRNIIPIFTSEMIIDTNKVTIIHRPFFFTEHIQSISIKNINDVFINTIPFFATIHLLDVGLPKSHIIVAKWFWKNEAEKARRIITGLMEASKEEIDLKTLNDDGISEKLEEIGRVREAKTSVSQA